MRTPICRLVLALSLASLTGCASQSGALRVRTASPELRETLQERERAWADAMSSHDYESLGKIMGEDFRLSFAGFPVVVPREEWLENLKAMSFGPISMDKTTVTMHGDAVATVRMHMTLVDWTVAGNPLPPNYHLTDIWVLRDDRWQVVNRISEPLEPSGPPMD